MNSIWKVGAATVTVALLGGFYLGRVASDPGPLPAVGQPVTVGSTVEPTPSTAETLTLRPRPSKTTSDRPEDTLSPDDTLSPEDTLSHDTNDDHGRNRGPGGGSDDDVRTISPPVVTPDDDGGFDDHGGGSNSGPG